MAGSNDSYVIDWQVSAEGSFIFVSHALGT